MSSHDKYQEYSQSNETKKGFVNYVTFKKYFLNCGSMVFPILKSINLHPDLLENINSKKAHTILIRF